MNEATFCTFSRMLSRPIAPGAWRDSHSLDVGLVLYPVLDDTMQPDFTLASQS